MKLIDKAALVAEIERLKNEYLKHSRNKFHAEWSCGTLDNILSFLDTIEVKEDNRRKELSYEDYIRFFEEHPDFPDDWGFDEAWVFAKHFFELGLKVRNLKYGKDNSMTDKVQKILSEIATRKLCTMDEHMAFYNDKAKEDYRLLSDIEEFIKALQEESVSEELEEAAKDYSNNLDNIYGSMGEQTRNAFKAGAKWQKKHLWKPADGENLPEFEREVIVFTQDFPNDAGIISVAIAHRPDPKGWDGKSITTGKIEHYTPKTYGKGGWNIPDVIMWLDLDIPKLEEG